jgi:uncharacterized alpha-E superfamily protein
MARSANSPCSSPRFGVRDLVRAGANLTSRVVENLFWLGRYSERFDDSARMLRVALSRVCRSWRRENAGSRLGHGTGLSLGISCPRPEKIAPVKEGSEHALLEAIYDPKQPGSLAAIFAA